MRRAVTEVAPSASRTLWLHVALSVTFRVAADIQGSGGFDPTDLKPNGSCKSAAGLFCSGTYGDARVANCLRFSFAQRNLDASLLLNAAPVYVDCEKEVSKFFVAVAMNQVHPDAANASSDGKDLIPVDVIPGFRQKCLSDAREYCQGDQNQSAHSCLKGHWKHLKQSCKDKMLTIDLLSAKNMALDPEFVVACLPNLQNIPECKEIPEFDNLGQRKACLKRHRQQLCRKCRNALFSKEKEDAKDIRLNFDVHNACRVEESKFCSDVQFGRGRMVKCLWNNRKSSGFGTICNTKIEKLVMRSMSNYKLDYRLRTMCKEEISSLCKDEQSKLDGAQAEGRADLAGSVFTCLKSQYMRIEQHECKREVNRIIRLHAEQATLDPVWRRKCMADVNLYCPASDTVRPSTVHLCLRKHLDDLSAECREVEILQGSIEARDITMKPALRHACARPIKEFCGHTPPGDGQVINCLQDHRFSDGFPSQCYNAVQDDLEASNHDLRLKFGISGHCRADAQKLCSLRVSMGGTKLIGCMRRKYDRVESRACRQELRRFFAQGSSNIMAAPDTYAACTNDVAFFCSDVSPGQGRLHACLMKHKEHLTEMCKIAEFEQQAMQANDIQLSPTTVQACKTYMTQFCPQVTMADGNMWRCLEDHKHEMRRSKCQIIVTAHELITNSEFHLNPNLAESCKKDAMNLCQKDLKNADSRDFSSDGGVIGCLITHRAQVADLACKRDMLRKQRQRLANIANDPEAVLACRFDLEKYCASVRNEEVGGAHKCLQAHMQNLTSRCREKEIEYVEMQAENVKLMPDMQQYCKKELADLCEDAVSEDGMLSTGQSVDCLLDNMHHPQITPGCQQRLVKLQSERGSNKAVSASLSRACAWDLRKLVVGTSKCAHLASKVGNNSESIVTTLTTMAEPGHGAVDCLLENSKLVKSPSCRRAIVMERRRQSNDIHAKPGMWNACKNDVHGLCPNVPPGGGRLHRCMRNHRTEIKSMICLGMIVSVEIAEGEDVRINPMLRRDCPNERRTFCKGVPPGKKRVIDCLISHVDDSGFGDRCKNAIKGAAKDVEKRIQKMKDTMKQEKFTNARDIMSWLEQHGKLGERGGMLTGMIVGSLFSLTIAGVCFWAIQKRLKQGYAVIVPRNLEA